MNICVGVLYASGGVYVCGLCMSVICMCLIWYKYVCMFCECLYISMWVSVHVSLTIACLLWFNDMHVCVLRMCMCACKYVSPIFLTLVHLNNV